MPNSVHTLSKKSSFHQNTKSILNNKISLAIPRLNELLSDEIFQYYFRTHFFTKEYSKFKSYSELEKLNIMIDLYFFINNKKANLIGEEPLNDNISDTNDDNKENNDLNKLLDKMLLLDNDYSRMNVIDKMKEYKLYSFNYEDNYSERFQKILNKYKNGNSNDIKDEEIDEPNTNMNYNNINTTNKINNNLSYSNLKYNSKPLSRTKFHISSAVNSNIENTPIKFKTQSKLNIIDNNNNIDDFKNNMNNIYNDVYNELIEPFRRENIYEKINIANIKMIKMGKIRQKKNISEDNIFNNVFEYEIKSKKNDIEDKDIQNYIYNNNQSSSIHLTYKVLKNKVMKKNLSPIFYNNEEDKNEIIIQEPLIICSSNVENMRNNLILQKQVNEGETNELIKKIYQFDGEKISFNKNEINKIGILLLNYVRLEKKFSTIETSLFIYKDKVNKMKEIIQIFSKKTLERINDSKILIKEQKLI